MHAKKETTVQRGQEWLFWQKMKKWAYFDTSWTKNGYNLGLFWHKFIYWGLFYANVGFLGGPTIWPPCCRYSVTRLCGFPRIFKPQRLNLQICCFSTFWYLLHNHFIFLPFFINKMTFLRDFVDLCGFLDFEVFFWKSCTISSNLLVTDCTNQW